MRAVLIVFTIALSADVAIGCSCGPAPPVLPAFERAHAVVIARVLSVQVYKNPHNTNADESPLGGGGPATLLVEKVYKGRLRVNEEFTAGGAPNAACIWSFYEKTVGQSFLLYLISVGEGRVSWGASTCGRSRGLEYATEDLLYLDNMERLRGKTRVSGSYHGWPNADPDNMANQTIRIVGEKKTYEAKTDAKGVYEIYDLPPGTYSLEPEIPKGWQMARFTSKDGATPKALPFTLEANKHVSVNVILEPSNQVEGSVVGPDGNPMQDVCVYLRKPEALDRREEFDCTDKDGRYLIKRVPAGSYYVMLNPDGQLTSDEPFPRLFYPSVTQEAKAALIDVGNGETVKGINFVITSLAETVTVSGVLRFSDGKPAAEEIVNFASFPREGLLAVRTEMTDTDGRFALKVLKGAKGELYADFEAEIGEYEKCPKLDALIRATGKEVAQIRSPSIKIEADHDVDNLVLQFPFPRCTRKE